MMARAGWVGLFFIVGLALLFVLAFRVDDEGHIFKGKYGKEYRTRMKRVGSVNRGSLVLLAGSGIRIGRVNRVRLTQVGDPGKDKHFEFEVTIGLKEEVEGLKIDIKEDSEARLAMTTILTGMHLEISPGTPGAKSLAEGGLIEAVESAGMMETISGLGDTFRNLGDGGLGEMLLGERGLENVDKVLEQVAQDGGLGKWILGEKAHAKLAPTLEEAQGTAANIRKATDVGAKGTVARLLHDEELGGRLDAIASDVQDALKGAREFGKNISEGKGTIARLVVDEELGAKVDGVITDFRAVAADLRRNESMLARLISDKEMGDDLKATVTSISKFADGLAKGEGTVARLINDPELYVEAKRFVSQAREAVEDAREQAPISAFTSVLFGALQ